MSVKIRMIAAAVAAGVASLAVGAPRATAALPAATGYISCVNADGSSSQDPTACSAALDSGARALGPDASLTAQSSYPGDFAPVSAGVFGVTDYAFTVVGPDTAAAIPVDIDVDLTQSIVANGYAFSELIATAGTDIFHSPNSATAVICSDGCGDDSLSFSGALQIYTELGLTSTIHMEIETADGFGASANSGRASVDPHIFVDPGFANAAAYSIERSPGVGNGLPGLVPEPAAWTTMLLGFGLMGAAMRSRRRISRSETRQVIG